MIVRDVTPADYETIKVLNQLQDFKLKSIDNAIIDKIVFCGDKPIAYGIVKRQGEAIILVNPEAPVISRAKAMQELMAFAEWGAKNEKCEQLHCFVSDPRLANALVKHYGFVISEDVVLVKNL